MLNVDNSRPVSLYNCKSVKNVICHGHNLLILYSSQPVKRYFFYSGQRLLFCVYSKPLLCKRQAIAILRAIIRWALLPSLCARAPTLNAGLVPPTYICVQGERGKWRPAPNFQLSFPIRLILLFTIAMAVRAEDLIPNLLSHSSRSLSPIL